jgi:subtilase family serine protease
MAWGWGDPPAQHNYAMVNYNKMCKCCDGTCSCCGKKPRSSRTLERIVSAHCTRLTKPSGNGKTVVNHATGLATGLSYTPAQIKTLYSMPVGLNGSGIKIAVIGAYINQYAARNLNEFSTKFNLPRTTDGAKWFNEWPMTGAVNDTPARQWNLEWDLDLQWAHAIAPNAELHAVYAKSSNMVDMLAGVSYAVNTLKANVISMSWGSTEIASESTNETTFKNLSTTANSGGLIFVASAGDTGAIVSYPSTSAYVLSIGGTSVNINSDSTRWIESAWSGTGGGISKYISKPAWQTNTNIAGNRSTPDISIFADPYTGAYVCTTSIAGSQYSTTSTVWVSMGGTSVGAPVFAGFMALVLQNRVNNKKSGLTNSVLETALYGLLAPGSANQYNACIYDIVNGSAKSTGATNRATNKYDKATGIGTIFNGSALIELLTNV